MLFSQIDRFDRQAEMISLMKVGQFWGHSCFKMETSTRFSLFSNVLWAFSDSSVLDAWMMKLTTKCSCST